MLKTFRYRLYPNQTQQDQIRKTADACRFVYNWALETKKTAYETDGTNLIWFDLNNRLKDLKQDHPFLKTAYSQSLQQAVKRFQLAFQHFFRRIKQGTDSPGYPRFKKRMAYRQSFDVPQFFTIDFAICRVYLPKIGRIKAVFHRRFSGTPKMCTIVSTLTGKFYISIIVEDGNPPPPKPPATNQTAVGIDVGVTTYITLSSGEKVANPRHLHNTLHRLQCLHRRLSRKQPGSRNREKARRRLVWCYERVAIQRNDFQ
jgi:putative transposase